MREQIEASIADVIPDGKSGAAVGVVTPDGMKLVVASKVGKNWRLAGEVSRKWGGKVTGRVAVVGVW